MTTSPPTVTPLYFTLREVSKILGWSKERTKRWLKREHALVKRAGQWVTTRDHLRRAFPEAYDEATIGDLEDDDDGD